jgi:hypothetical protein
MFSFSLSHSTAETAGTGAPRNGVTGTLFCVENPAMNTDSGEASVSMRL